MAGPLRRTNRCRFFSNHSYSSLISVRTVSSSVSQKVETISVVKAQPQHEKVGHYPAVGNNHYIRNKPARTPGQYPFRSQDELSKASRHVSRDPLQHILNHPSASIILRDACKCIKCKDHSTSQRDFNLAHIPIDIQPSTASQDAQGNWVIRWLNDMPGWEDHVSVFTPQQIARLETHMSAEHQTSTELWNNHDYTRNRCSVDYRDYMNSNTALAKTLYDFARYGLIFIENVPEDEDAVARMAERIAGIKQTFYGQTWDVKSIPNAKNVAYTNKYLGFHSDLMYLKEPPMVQYLHCVHNSCQGGESRFVDQFAALDTLYSEDGEAADDLANIRLRYEYENDSFYYSDIKPIVQWRADGHTFPRRTMRGAVNGQLGNVYRMFWSPPFLGSVISGFAGRGGDGGVSNSTLKKSVAAMNRYADILERDELVYEEKMVPGTCVMFDNLRVLHARNEFDVVAGRRWLRGTYLDAQDLWSVEIKLKDHMARLEAANYPD